MINFISNNSFVLELLLVLIIIVSFAVAVRFIRGTRNKLGMSIATFGLLTILILLLIMFIFNIYLFLILFIYVVFVLVSGKILYNKPKIKIIDIKTDKIQEKIDILFVADFQFDKNNNSFNEKSLKRIIKLINEQNYDLLLVGGDYVNYSNHVGKFFSHFNNINTHDKPKISIFGNHDFAFLNDLKKQFKDNNFITLDNEFTEIEVKGQKITICGVEDLWTGNPDFLKYKNELDQESFKILLTHNPDYVDFIKMENIDLVLAGHYHKGQVNFIPILPFPRMISKYIYGMFHVEKVKLYVTSGVGGSFLRGKNSVYARYFARSEINIIKVIPTKK